MYENNSTYSYVQSQEGVKRFITNVYSWMTLGIFSSGLVALLIAGNPNFVRLIFSNMIFFFAIIIVEIALVYYISSQIMKMSIGKAIFFFILYSAINGLTLSVIFLAYTSASIAATFFITAGTFAAMSAYGYLTKADLSKWGNILFMLLIGVIIASLVNLFLKSPFLYWIITYVGIAVFVGLTAYDTQKIKNMYSNVSSSSEAVQKLSILGALILYLDFINLFLLLLRLFGRRK